MQTVAVTVWVETDVADMNNKTTFKVSLGGVISALCIALMLLSSILPVGTFAFPAFAGMLLTVITVELGQKWGWLVYLSISLLSFFLLSNKEAMIYFVFFLGFYPILKSNIEKLKSKFLQYIIKFAVFNICAIVSFFLGIFVFGIPKESYNLFNIYLPQVFLILGNLFFVIYDRAVTVIVSSYINIWRKKIKGNKFF